ncbi:MAG: hypothetical protein LBQ22_04965 [Bacteroidales bacterium]|jgi:hypothetical protein|nr:hypothetical protein [Bacteroidales bacterium]
MKPGRIISILIVVVLIYIFVGKCKDIQHAWNELPEDDKEVMRSKFHNELFKDIQEFNPIPPKGATYEERIGWIGGRSLARLGVTSISLLALSQVIDAVKTNNCKKVIEIIEKNGIPIIDKLAFCNWYNEEMELANQLKDSPRSKENARKKK